MNTRRLLPPLLAGALLAAGLAVMAFRGRAVRAPERSDSPAEARTRRYADARAELDRAIASRDRLRRDVEALRKAEAELRTKREGEEEGSDPAEAAPGLADRMASMMRNVLLLQAEKTTAVLERRLGLSPEQKSRVHELLVENAEHESEFYAEKDDEDPARLRTALARVLTGPQLAAYDDYRREEDARLEEAQRAMLVDTLRKDLELNDEQAKAARAALAIEPALKRALAGPVEARTPEEVEAWIESTRVEARRLAAVLQPSLAPPQILKLEERLARREREARELAGLLRLFAAEPAPR